MPRPVDNPPNPWLGQHTEWLEEPPAARLEVFKERARSALSENKSPDVPFRWGVNPYRGCLHGCAYCYARPTHEYLGFGAGTDFDRKIVVKTNIADVLANELDRPSWKGEAVCLSGNTDCYQALEASYGLTRRCLEVLADRATPVSVITKSALVARDVDVLVAAAARAPVSVTVSIPILDVGLARALEPWASSPARRLEALRRLSAAGLDTCVSISPLIPGINDDQIARVLEEAHAAGARRAFMTMLRLPGPVREVFESRLRQALPLRAERVLSGLADARQGGRLDEGRFHHRMAGAGPRWQIARQLFEQRARALGFRSHQLDELSALDPTLGESPEERARREATRRGARRGQLPLL